MNTLTFNSSLRHHHINYELEFPSKTAYINEISYTFDNNTNSEYITEFVLMLNGFCSELKSKGIDKIMQPVLLDDWNDILSNISEFKLLNEKDSFVHVICDVNQFPIAFMKSMGLEK